MRVDLLTRKSSSSREAANFPHGRKEIIANGDEDIVIALQLWRGQGQSE